MSELIRLANGVRIVTQPIAGSRTAAIGFFIGTGSRHEKASENGAAHFIEHMLFKGTSRRSAADIARETDAIGGQVNAYTTKESTCFYAWCLDKHLDRAAALLCDMLFDSRFDQGDVELERGVILEEIGMYEDSPDELAADRLFAAAYKGSPLGRPILGRASTLRGMTGEGLKGWQKTHYRPDKMVISLSGSFSPATLQRLGERFSALPSTAPPEPKPAVYAPAFTVRRKAIEQNHLILGFPALSYLDKRRYPLILLNSILGGGVSSRLFQQLRENRGLCYSVYSYLSDYADGGILGIYTALSRELEETALETACGIIKELALHGPTGEELERAREQAKANVIMSMESTQAQMSHMGNSLLLFHRLRTADEILEAYDRVTREEVRLLGQELLDFSRVSLSAVGRTRSPEGYQTLLEKRA